MSKKHRKRHNAVTELHPLEKPLTSLLVPHRPMALSHVEDRRTFHPLGPARPALQVSGHPVKPNRIKTTKIKVKRSIDGRPMKTPTAIVGVPSRIKFADPKRTIICLKRKIREEVLHAFGRTGKGGKRKPRSRRNGYSHVSC